MLRTPRQHDGGTGTGKGTGTGTASHHGLTQIFSFAREALETYGVEFDDAPMAPGEETHVVHNIWYSPTWRLNRALCLSLAFHFVLGGQSSCHFR